MALNVALILTIFLTRERWAAWQPASRFSAPWDRMPEVSLSSRRGIFFGDSIELRDIDNGTFIASYPGDASHSFAGFSQDGSRAWIRGGVQEDIGWWSYCPPIVIDASSGDVLWSVEVNRDTQSVYFSRGGDVVFITPVDGNAVIYDTKAGKIVAGFPGERPSAITVTFSSSGRYAYVDVSQDSAQLWDLATGERMTEFDIGAVLEARFLPGETQLVLLFRRGDMATVKLVDLGTYKTTETVRAPVSFAFLSPCGTRLIRVVESEGVTFAHIHDVLDGAELAHFRVEGVSSMPKFTASGGFVAIPSHNGTSLYGGNTGRLTTKCRSNMFIADLAQHLPGGRRLFLHDDTTDLTVGDVVSGNVLATIPDVAEFKAISDEAVFVLSLSDDAVALTNPVRPEQWWGVLWLWHFWLIVALALAVAWSGWRDIKRIRRLNADG